MKDEATKQSIEVVDLNLRSVEYFQMVGNDFLATNIFDTGTAHFIRREPSRWRSSLPARSARIAVRGRLISSGNENDASHDVEDRDLCRFRDIVQLHGVSPGAGRRRN
jgi:hypothetical protein